MEIPITNQPIEEIVSPRTKVTNFKPQQKRKTAHGIILGLNQKFKNDVKKDPNKQYSARELEILFWEKVAQLNAVKAGIPEKEAKDNVNKIEGDFCRSCGQRIKQSFKISLSKNNIGILWEIHKLMNGEDFIETSKLYSVINGSSTAELTRLKYLGAIYPYFNATDYEKGSKRPGKWAITKHGRAFLKKYGKLPEYVIVKDEEVVEVGEGIFIDDETLHWMDEEEIWKDMKEHWNTEDELKV